MRLTREQLIHPNHIPGQDNTEDIGYIEYWSSQFFPDAQPGLCMVSRFNDCNETIRNVCNWNGGDEDWVVFVEKEFSDYDMPPWLGATSACGELDVYVLNGVVIYVESHT